jgi:hypothetical protein
MLIEKAAITRPIFIVGTIRSGTTLLAEMLDRSPHIAYCPFELKDLWSQVGGIPMASAKTRDLNCPEYSAKDTRNDQRENLLASFFQRMTTCAGKAPGAIFLNKNPHLSNKLPLVHALFPDARFIWIHRDLPQVVASIKRLFEDVCQRQGTWHWWPYPSKTTKSRCWNAFHSLDDRPDVSSERIFPGGDIEFIAEYWFETNRAIADFFAATPAAWRLKIAEEALVANPDKEIGRIAAKLETAFPIEVDLKNHIDRSRNEQWRDLLDDRQLESLEGFVRTYAKDIDEIFPGGGHVLLYLAMVRGVADEATLSLDR